MRRVSRLLNSSGWLLLLGLLLYNYYATLARRPQSVMTSQDKSALKQRIQGLENVLKQVCKIAGTPGISIGVSCQGEILHELSWGLRDVESKLPIDTHTVIPMGTMAKTITASAVGRLVADGKLKWTTPIRDILPDFRSSDPVVEAELNVVDLLCHRGGIARSNFWWQGSESVLLLDKKDLLSFYQTLPRAGNFRADWAYNNWGYALVGAVIEKLSGQTYGEYVTEHILRPLGLKDTTFEPLDYATAENLAKPYAALDDASPYLLPPPPVNDRTIMTAAMGGASSSNDLLRYSIALLQAYQQEAEPTLQTGEPAVLKNILKQLSGQIHTAPGTLEKSYAFGWYRTQLPNNVLGMGWNSIYVANMPRLVPRSHSGPIVAHGGSLPGYHTAVALLPALQASVVVTTNSIALGDVSGWASLAIAEALIDAPEPSDFVALATEAAGNNIKNVDKLSATLAEARPDGPKSPSRPLSDYVGRYKDPGREWIVEIRADGPSSLKVAFQGLDSQAWPLWYYGRELAGETWCWLASREEQARRGRMTTYPLVPAHFKLTFAGDDESKAVTGLYWGHEAGVALERQVFAKI